MTLAEDIATMKVCREHPEKMERYNQFIDKKDGGEITDEELKEYRKLQRKLETKARRIVRHYQGNLPLMNREKKQELKDEVEEFKSEWADRMGYSEDGG